MVDCPECNIELEYDRTAPKPSGYALVYKCPNCGREDTSEAVGGEDYRPK
jgi:ssDNA-binding Zn-finger/Zn-ribbon topoisomerase 1